RAYMTVLAGLGVMKGTSDVGKAMALIDYLTQPTTQIVTARAVGFFPVVNANLPPDLDQAHDVKIRIMGDFAIIHAAFSYTTPDGQQAHGRYTDCWAKQNGKWLAVSAHVTR